MEWKKQNLSENGLLLDMIKGKVIIQKRNLMLIGILLEKMVGED